MSGARDEVIARLSALERDSTITALRHWIEVDGNTPYRATALAKLLAAHSNRSGAPAPEVEGPPYDVRPVTREELEALPEPLKSDIKAQIAGPSAGETDQRTFLIWACPDDECGRYHTKSGAAFPSTCGAHAAPAAMDEWKGPRLEPVEVVPKSELDTALRQRDHAWRIGDADLGRTMEERDRALRERDEEAAKRVETERARDQANGLAKCYFEDWKRVERERDEAREALADVASQIRSVLEEGRTAEDAENGLPIDAAAMLDNVLDRAAGSEEENRA